MEKHCRMLTDSHCTRDLGTALRTLEHTLCTAWLVQELSVVTSLIGITRNVLSEKISLEPGCLFERPSAHNPGDGKKRPSTHFTANSVFGGVNLVTSNRTLGINWW